MPFKVAGVRGPPRENFEFLSSLDQRNTLSYAKFSLISASIFFRLVKKSGREVRGNKPIFRFREPEPLHEVRLVVVVLVLVLVLVVKTLLKKA